MRTGVFRRCSIAAFGLLGLLFALPVLGQSISYVAKPASVGSGLQSSTIFARLSSGAHGGLTVRVQSGDSNVALISDAESNPGGEFVDFFVPNGTTDALFFVQALENITGSVTITASAPGFSDGIDSLSVVTPGVQITNLTTTHNLLDVQDEFRAQVGIPQGSLLALLQKVRAGGPGLTVTFSNGDAAVGELVTTGLTAQVVTAAIAAGEHSSPSTVAAGGVAFDYVGDGSTQVDASIPGFIQLANAIKTVNVSAASISFIALPASIGIGLQKAQLRARISGTEHGGTLLRVESADSLQVLLSLDRFTLGTGLMDVYIPNGSTDVVFHAQVLESAGVGPVGITASAAGFPNANSSINVVSPYFGINSLQTSGTAFDPIDEFTFQVGLPNGAQNLIIESQQARGGGPGLSFVATSSDSTVGLLETTGARNDSVLVHIDQGQFSSPSSIAAGGVGFDGVGLGITQITGTSPNFFPISKGIVDVTVTQPGISWIGIPTEGVGSGLQSIVARARLGASLHGGVNVHITSSDSTLILLSASEDAVGSGSIEIPLSNGSIDAFFYMQGIENNVGSVTLYADAAGFAPDSTVVSLVMPYVRIAPGTLASTLDTLDPPDEFFADVGVLSGTSFLIRDVRPGVPALLVNVTIDDSSAELLSLNAPPGDSTAVSIPSLSGSSPSSVASGGVALNGLVPGSVTVSVSAPGFLQAAGSSEAVTITAPSLSFSGVSGTQVGSGLQSNPKSVLLSASDHGGVTVHIESGDSTKALVAEAPTDPGLPAIDVELANGVDSISLYIHGIDGTTGSVSITTSAPGFSGDSALLDVVTPGVEILDLESTIDVADGSDSFWARVGIPNIDQSALGVIQSRRGGAPPLIVSMMTSNVSASQLQQGVVVDDSVAVSIEAGENVSPFDLMSGGVRHLPQAEGQTLVTASIPGFIQTGAAQQIVDITNENTYIAGVLGRLGAGLQTPVLTAELGESNHGGVTMHIGVDDSLKALLSLNALTVGSGSLDVPLVNGSTDVPFYVQAFEASSGPVIVTASVTGYPSAIDTILIVPPALDISALTDSIAVGDADDEFLVRVGAVNADSSGIAEPQAIWAGGDTTQVNLSSSDGAIGEFVTLLSSGPAVVVDILPGSVQTAGTVLGGGVAFHPAGLAGTATVSATIPGFVASSAATHLVSVTGTVSETPRSLPAVSLGQNVPNPFNPSTTIHFELPARAHVNLSVFDLGGRRIATLVDELLPAESFHILWNARDRSGSRVSSGVYFYRLVVGNDVLTRKMVLVK